MDKQEKFAEMVSLAKDAIENFNDFHEDRAVAWAGNEMRELRTALAAANERAEQSEAREKGLREALEVICALVMKYDIPSAWEAREIAQDALKEVYGG